jgi:hypothetical protein
VATVTVTVEAEASAAPFTPVGNATDSLVAFPAKATALALTPVTFRAAAGGASTAAKKKRRRPPVGTTVRYQLDKASLVTFTVEQALPGRRQGTSCVKPIKALRKAKKCTRFVVKSGAFTHNGQAGANALPFTGRLADKRLGRGRYRLVATPAPLGGTAAVAVRAPFRVVK